MVVVLVSVAVGSSVTAGSGSAVGVCVAGGATVVVGVVVHVAEVTATDCGPLALAPINDTVQTPAESVAEATAEDCRFDDNTVRVSPSVQLNSREKCRGRLPCRLLRHRRR